MALVILWTNRATSKLAGAINNTATSLALNPGTGALFPNPTVGEQYFTLSLTDAATGQNHEIMWCTARTGDLLTVTRGQEGTAAQNWMAGDIAANQLTAASLAQLGQLPVLSAASQIAPFFTQGEAGTYTTTVPANVFGLYAWVIGAGGGGAGCNSTYTGGGGGAGGFAATRIDNVVPGQIISVTVGAGGSQGAANVLNSSANGGNGGTSSVGSWVSASGGSGGQSFAGPIGGGPGLGSISGVDTSAGWFQYGGYGTNGTSYNAGAGWGGNGGTSFTGGSGGMQTIGGPGLGAAGGGGGGGYSALTAVGQPGQNGFVIMWPAVEGP